MDFEKKLQGYLYDCVEPFNHWLPWIWLDEGHLMPGHQKVEIVLGIYIE